jgi:hypothetical protein
VTELLELLLSLPVLIGIVLAFAVLVWLGREATH